MNYILSIISVLLGKPESSGVLEVEEILELIFMSLGPSLVSSTSTSPFAK